MVWAKNNQKIRINITIFNRTARKKREKEDIKTGFPKKINKFMGISS